MPEKSTSVNVSPDPRILEAITYSPIPPINALCELIDNSIDGFKYAEEQGIKVEEKIISIYLPSHKDLEEGVGKLTVRDNGPGLSMEEAEKAVTAGYSSKNHAVGTLGLFGLGFNISSGKLGRRTVFTGCREKDEDAFSIIIDLVDMKKTGTFDVPIEYKRKLNPNRSYTEIEISDWWPKGEKNYGFINKLASMSKPKLREQIGRIYSAILKNSDLRIMIDGIECPVFNHCVWSEKRFVFHNGERIYARINVDENLGSEVRCTECGNLFAEMVKKCPICEAEDSVRKINKRIIGWVGIQRFDDKDKFGIDLIRNGRTIRVFEKDAFFTWVNEEGIETKEYPVDGIYGRIVGEIQIDFVPVDYLKTDFNRNSPEWNEVITKLRGSTSLLPRTAREESNSENNSPIYKLFQGYRKVRTPGTKDMYMGYWDPIEQKAKRIDRKTEQELYEKFKNDEPGYFDDSEWWKYVEQADQSSSGDIVTKECPECKFQNAATDEICENCGVVLISKKCVNEKCTKEIPFSAEICPECGANQLPEEDKGWKCNSCNFLNPSDSKKCLKCGEPIFTLNVFDVDYLIENSNRNEELSMGGFSIPLPEGEIMDSINLNVYYLKPSVKLVKGTQVLPLYAHKTGSDVNIFIDPTHKGINLYQDRPEDYISMEIAKYLIDKYASRVNDRNRPFWSISNLYYTVHNVIWKERVELSAADTSNQANAFLDQLYCSLPDLFAGMATDIYDNYDQREQILVTTELVKNNINLADIETVKRTGKFLRYLPEKLLVDLLSRHPERFFDGNFWTDPYKLIPIDDPIGLKDIQESVKQKYLLDLQDIIAYKNYRNPETGYTQKINLTLNLIKKNLAKNV